MSNRSSANSISFSEALTLILFAFKLAHIIDWSWWLIWAPLLLSFIIQVIVYALSKD